MHKVNSTSCVQMVLVCRSAWYEPVGAQFRSEPYNRWVTILPDRSEVVVYATAGLTGSIMGRILLGGPTSPGFSNRP